MYKRQSLILAAKGGYNEESHNHNDIGTFLLYRDGSPVIVDIGSATYCAKTFSAKRYEMFNNSSAYHCCPVIDRIPQQAGMEYRARQVCFQEDDGQIQFSLDIAAAYPSVAPVSYTHLDVYKRQILLSPICPHSLMTRTVVFGEASKLKVRVNSSGNESEAFLTIDGEISISLKDFNSYIHFEKAPQTAKIIKLKNTNFYEIVNNKLAERRA